MLSAAHVLAMDAKNLLDVVDSIRVRYPELFVQQDRRPSMTAPTANILTHPIVISDQMSQQQQFGANMTSSMDDGFEQMQTYQNLSELADSVNAEIYANQEQIQQIHGSEGIYDNECVINAQLKSMSIENDEPINSQPNHSVATAVSTTSAGESSAAKVAKPPVAAKPTNVQQKIKAFNSGGFSLATTSPAEKYPPSTVSSHDEPLKIIENESDLYCNTKAIE